MAGFYGQCRSRFPEGLGGAGVEAAACASLPPIGAWENIRRRDWLANRIGGHSSAHNFNSTRAPQTPRNPIASLPPTPSH